MLSDFELEVIERDYFRYILTFLRANLTPIIDGLNSRIKIWFFSKKCCKRCKIKIM